MAKTVYIAMKGTRHTQAGTFRFGHCYAVAPDNEAARQALAPLLEAEVAEKITKAQAEKAQLVMVELATPGPSEGAAEGEAAPAEGGEES